VSASDRERPLFTGVNGPLMAPAMLARPMAITHARSPIGRETGTFTAPDHGRQKHAGT
jgi:hypothetical protein